MTKKGATSKVIGSIFPKKVWETLRHKIVAGKIPTSPVWESGKGSRKR